MSLNNDPSSLTPLPHHREGNKYSVQNIASTRRRQQALVVAKERREALIRAKRFRRGPLHAEDEGPSDSGMFIDQEIEDQNEKTAQAVEELKSAQLYEGKGAAQKRIEKLRSLRLLLSQSEEPSIEAAIQAGAVTVLVKCLSFGSSDEQLLEAAWCLTNIAAGSSNDTKSLMPALPLLIAHLGEKSSANVAEQCAWALGNVSGEGAEMRDVLLAQGALLPLARLMLSNKGTTARTVAWALSNLIKGPNPKAANELIGIEGVLNAIISNLETEDDELATEVAWVVVYLSALSEKAVNLLAKGPVAPLLVLRFAKSEQLMLLIPLLRSLGNLLAADNYLTDAVLVVGHNITDQALSGLIKCLKSEHRVLKKEASWVLSNLAAGGLEHKRLMFHSEATTLLINLLKNAPFDIRREAAFTLGNLCVHTTNTNGPPGIITEHLVCLVNNGCLSGFVNLVRSADIESARLGLQFLELVMRGYPNGEGPKLVEMEEGIEAMERFQFHENEEMRIMANGLVDKYFGEDYGVN